MLKIIIQNLAILKILTIFKNDAHEIVSERGQEVLGETNNKFYNEDFDKKINEGVFALKNGKPVKILRINSAESYKIALAIKDRFIRQSQIELHEKIKIEGKNEITISFKN